MTAQSIIALVRKFVQGYGVSVSWYGAETVLNSRGVPITQPGTTLLTERVLLLKERYNPINDGTIPVGMGPDLTRYIMALPDSRIKKGDVVTDGHGDKWRLGSVDWFDISGTPVCKQTPVERVE